jgi:hypothetical protein
MLRDNGQATVTHYVYSSLMDIKLYVSFWQNVLTLHSCGIMMSIPYNNGKQIHVMTQVAKSSNKFLGTSLDI